MERNYAIDFIKFFAIVAVVIIHTFPSDDKIGFFLLDNFSRFAVPFFFVASGYLFGLKAFLEVNGGLSCFLLKEFYTKSKEFYTNLKEFYTKSKEFYTNLEEFYIKSKEFYKTPSYST